MTEIIQDMVGMQSLADQWNSLATHFKTPLLRHEWFTACAEAFCPAGRLYVVVVRSQGTITAIAPLTLIKRAGVQRLEFLGSSFLDEPSGLLYADKASFAEIVHAVLDMGRPILFKRLLLDCSKVNALRKICKKKGLVRFWKDTGSPWVPIGESPNDTWATFEARISSSRQASIRRARKRAEKLGNLEFQIISPKPDELGDYLREVFHVEAAGWKGREGSAMLSKPSLKHFFTKYSHAVAQLGLLRLCFCRINGKAVATQLAVQYANRFWLLKIGYDEDWARCSPGILLTHETIRYSFDQALKSFEFLGSDQPWIHIWTDKVTPFLSSQIYPFSLKGLLGWSKDVPRSSARKVRSAFKSS